MKGGGGKTLKIDDTDTGEKTGCRLNIKTASSFRLTMRQLQVIRKELKFGIQIPWEREVKKGFWNDELKTKYVASVSAISQVIYLLGSTRNKSLLRFRVD